MSRNTWHCGRTLLICATLLVVLMNRRDVAGGTQSAHAAPVVQPDGLVRLPPLGIPLSSYMSPQARNAFLRLFYRPALQPSEAASAQVLRRFDDRQNARYLRRAQRLWPVVIWRRVIGGVPTMVVTPQGGVAPVNRDRVLINLHGGTFIWGWPEGALAESIPIAGVAKIRVVTVDYREAPESRFPAASEDVAAVYRALLKRYGAANIGIYGSSAGGMLTAEAIAWFERNRIPLPGAIGTFCGSADAFGGDNGYLASVLIGQPSSRAPDIGTLSFSPYFSEASASDPLVLPVHSLAVMGRFPPTLLITGSRDFTASSLFHVQAVLSSAGVSAQLHVWDGMWHVFYMDPNLPESRQMYQVVARFFERHLGLPPRLAEYSVFRQPDREAEGDEPKLDAATAAAQRE